MLILCRAAVERAEAFGEAGEGGAGEAGGEDE